jgi:hypothetical protein
VVACLALAVGAVACGGDDDDASDVSSAVGIDRSIIVWEILVAQAVGGQVELYIDASTGAVVENEATD